MRQTLHIFWKDARRFWPEILISLAITAAFVRIYPVNWLREDATHGGGFPLYWNQFRILANTLTGLMPFSWMILIARAVHAETLVGDRQFWITRPYEWPTLLAAKALFIGVFVYVPFFAAQCGLLAEGGFAPFAYVPGMLFNLLLTTLVLVLPLMALAAVTSNFVRMVLTLLGVALCGVALAFVSSLHDSSSMSTPDDGGNYALLLIFVVVSCAVVFQYARRKVWLSRSLLLSGLVAVGVIAIYLPNGAMVDAAYPAVKPGPAGLPDTAMQFSFHDESLASIEVRDEAKGDEVEIQIPLKADGVTPGHAVQVDDVMATIDGANGVHWNSSWQSVYNERFLQGEWESHTTFKMKRSVYERVRGLPVTLKLSFAVTELRAGEVNKVVLREDDFTVPGLGICSTNTSIRLMSGIPNLDCRYALHGASLMQVQTTLSNKPCDEAASEPGKTTNASAWVGSLDNLPADFGMTSVWTTNVSLSNGDYSEKRALCPGAALTLTQYGLVRRLRSEVRIANLRLPAVKNSSNFLMFK